MADNTYRYLTTLLEAGSFSRAAERLAISQPSLSQFVQRLEVEAGATLIDRHARPVQLTPAGACWLETERRIAALRDRRAQELADLGAGIKGTVRIGASHYRSTYFLTAVLPRFRQLFPDVDITLEEGTTQELESFVLEGKTDVSIVLLPLAHPALAAEPLYREKLLIALAAEHPLARQTPEPEEGYPTLSFAALDKAPFIRIKPGQKFHTLFETLCRATQAAPHVVLDSESPMAALSLASVGVGATLVTQTLARRAALPGRVRYFAIDPIVPDRVVVAAYRRDRYQAKAARALVDVMREVGAQAFVHG